MTSLMAARARVVDNGALQGSDFCQALSDAVDAWLIELFGTQVGDRPSVALMAVGGYGRAELAPHSDLDVLLVHDLDSEIEKIAADLWYPLWDEGAKLGHSVRTIREATELARTDLDTATSLLTVRHLAGDKKLSEKLGNQARTQWRRNGRKWVTKLNESSARRHNNKGEVAFMLEPALKEGRGGLRDVHTAQWASLATRGSGTLEETGLAEPYEVILRARVALHRESGRAGNVLLLEDQDAVAAALNYDDADVMMGEISSSARFVAWQVDEVLTRLLDGVRRRRPRFRRPAVVVGGPGVTIEDQRVRLAASEAVTPEAVLRVAAAAAHHDARLASGTIKRFQETELEVPAPWSDEVRKLFVDLLKAGHAAIPVIETMDRLDLFVPFIPEWAPTRSRPQRNAYHRFTVDRHLWEAAAEAVQFQHEVDRPDLLLIGALLHDIGKGYTGDHTEVGMELIADIGERMNFPPSDTAILVKMCEHHLLLPDVATRRDLDDDDTIRSVADAAGTVRVLYLLRALTEADSVATGPSAWSSWKAGLVRDLTARAVYVLEGGDVGELPRNFPTEEQREKMRRGTTGIHAEGETLTVMVLDRPGVLSRVAGGVTLNGLEVIEAAAHVEFGIAVAMFQVQSGFDDDIDWDRVCRSVEDSLRGQIALAARIDERIRTYARSSPVTAPQRIVDTKITIDNNLSSAATVLEVAAPNGIGLLYYMTRALSQLDLDIASAKVQTLGDDVVDTFYLRDRDGQKVVDPSYLAELERAIHHALRIASAHEENPDG